MISRMPPHSEENPVTDELRDAAAARSAAMALLARRDFSSSELQGKLRRKGFHADACAAAIADMVASRALDDERYAQNYVSYHAGRGQGPLRIHRDLKALGVPAAAIEAALAAGPGWLEQATQVTARKFGPERPADRAEWARRARFLQYRGFSSDHIRAALGADLNPD